MSVTLFMIPGEIFFLLSIFQFITTKIYLGFCQIYKIEDRSYFF
jgi:hypothetical protein